MHSQRIDCVALLALALARCGGRGSLSALPAVHGGGAASDTALSRRPVPSGASFVWWGGKMNDCAWSPNAGVRISAHCIGPIAWDSTLGDIRKHFPDVVEYSAVLENTPVVIWEFAFGRAKVGASQQDSRMDPHRPADSWIVSGDDVVLPGGGRLLRLWGDFRKTYRSLSVLNSEVGIVANTCQMPGLEFVLLIPPGPVPSTLETDSIPANTQIIQVLLDRSQPPSDSLVAC